MTGTKTSESAPDIAEADGRVETAHAMYLSAVSAWRTAMRQATGAAGDDGDAAQEAVAITQSAYLKARDRLEAARTEREELRRRLYAERVSELRAAAMVDALVRQDQLRQHDREARRRGVLSRLFHRR